MSRVYFYLAAKQSAGQAEVRVRFTATGINRRAATGVLVPVAAWDAAAGQCIISRRYETPENAQARRAQAQLDELAERITLAYMRDRSAADSPNWLENIITPRDESERPIYAIVDEYCDARNTSPATRAKLHALATHLRAFGQLRGDIYASTLDVPTLERFFAYMLHHGSGHAQNSAACRLRQLRTLVYWHGKPHPNPFDTFTIPSDVYGDPIYLTKDERDFVAMYDDLTLAQKRQRDIFIFQCHTGCRVADLYALTEHNIRDGWLVYVPKKTTRGTPRSVEVPLSDTALAIVERYRGIGTAGRLLPFIAPQQYNRAIQRVLKACAIRRPVMVLNPRTFETRPQPLCDVATSHTARKTFIQIAYAATGNKRLVASMSGHSENSQAFNRYSEINREMKTAALGIIRNGENLAK